MNKRFIIASLAVIISFLAIDFLFGKAMDWCAANSRGGETANIHYILEDFNDSVAVFGSSRAYHHYDPDILGESLGVPVYNCGIDGNGVLLAYSFLQNMVAMGRKPQMVIYDFFPDFDLYDNADHQRPVNIVSPYYRHKGMKEIIDELSPDEYYKLLLSTYRYNSKFLQVISDAISPRQKLMRGYKPLTGVISTEFKEDGTKPARIIDPIKADYFSKFVKLCEDNGIDLVFVTSPMYHTIESPEEYVKSFNKYVGEDYDLIDFRNHGAFTGENELFVDPAHMNLEGAAKFSRAVADTIASRRIL